MAKKSEQYIPDQSGTIYVKGFEGEIAEFTRKKTFFDVLKKEVDSGKIHVRNLATEALAKAAEGAMRVCMMNGIGGAVSMTVPDYEKDGNRTAISDAAFKKFMKAGGSEALEMEEGEVFDTVAITGSRSIVLSGKWLTWFEDQYLATGKVVLENEEDIMLQEIESSVSRKLSFASIARLKAVAVSGSEKARKAAGILLDAGLKAMTVRVEEGT